MKVTVKEVCDLCRRTLPVLGSKARSGNTSVYRVRETGWRFFSQRLSWAPDSVYERWICGDCWERIRKEARELEEQKAADTTVRFITASACALTLAVSCVPSSIGGGTSTMTIRQLSDAHVGNTRRELVAQRHHSATVIRFFVRGHRWMLAVRRATCWRVPWTRTCSRARAILKAHRWLRDLAGARLERLYPAHPPNEWAEFDCIHRHEGGATQIDGSGTYYGGLQMDLGFQNTYGAEFVQRWGTANRWPIWAQVVAARRARDGYGRYGARGYGPWPNTARMCGQL